MTPYDPKDPHTLPTWPGMAGNGCGWSGMARNGWGIARDVCDGRGWPGMVGNGRGWLGMAGNGRGWPLSVPVSVLLSNASPTKFM